MTSFIGDYTGKVDSKGRVVLPSSFVKQMSDANDGKFVIKNDIFEKCLILYSIDEWERQKSIIRAKINPYKRDHNKFLREFYRNTFEVALDSNNRILLPAKLVEYAEIKKEVNFSGQDKKIEIWSGDIYQSVAQESDDFANLAEDIMGGDLPEA